MTGIINVDSKISSRILQESSWDSFGGFAMNMKSIDLATK